MSQLAGYANTSAVCLDDCFHDCESHSGTLNAIPLALPAVELVEDQRALEVVDAAAAIGDAGDEPITLYFGADENRRSRLRVLNRVLEQMAQDFYNPCRIHRRPRKLLGNADLDGILRQNLLGFIQGLIDDRTNRIRRKFEFDLIRIELSHFDSFANQTIQTIALFIDHRE